MLLGKALLALAWAATATAVPANGAKNTIVARGLGPSKAPGPDDAAAGPSNAAAEKGGLYRFEFVVDYMSPGDGLARSSAPNYQGEDSDQKITPDTIAAFRLYNVTHVISANHEANDETIKKALADAGIDYTPLPVPDFEAATAQDFQRGWDAFVQHRSTGNTLVWCGYGHGRTGTMITALQIHAEHERGEMHTWTHQDYVRNHVETAEQEARLNQLQETLRAQAVPAPTDQELADLRAGNFAQLNCVTLLAAMLTRNHLSERSTRREVKMIPRQATPNPSRVAPKKFGCERAQQILLTEDIPVPCKKIKNIQLGVAFSNDLASGSWDDIGATLEGPAGNATLHVSTQPERGSHTWATVNMQESYKKDEIEVSGINKLTLNAAGIANQPWRFGGPGINDEWQVEDIQIRADCADPGFAAKDDSLVGLNAWYGHPGGWFWAKTEKKTVATFPIVPGDWAFAPPCAIIKELSYDFKLAEWYGGGTYDALAFSISDGKTIDLGESVDYTFHKDGKIDLKAIFGKDQVDIRDLKELHLLDNHGSNGAGDPWAFQGLTLSATCATSSRKMAMKKYQAVNQWVGYVETGPAWTGAVAASDWLEVVA